MPLTVPAYFLSTETNRVIGANSGQDQTGNNVFLGGNSAGDDNTADNVVAIGVSAAAQNAAADVVVIGNLNRPGLTATADGSIMIGHRILAAMADPADINGVIAIGVDVMGNMIPTAGIGESVIIGHRAMRGGLSGSAGGSNPNRMVIVGYEAGERIQRDGASSDENTLIGYRAGRGNDANGNNILNCTFVGAGCGENISSGSNNTAMGNGAMGSGTITGARNVAIGNDAGSNIGSGADNVCIGASSSVGSTGTNNVVIGSGTNAGAGASNANVSIGANAGWASGTGGNCVLIGTNAGANVSAASGRFVLESSTTGDPVPFLFGDLVNGNMTLGNLATAGTPTGRVFGTGATNNFKLQFGTGPTTPITNGVSLIAVDNAGTIELQVIGPGGVAQVLATGL